MIKFKKIKERSFKWIDLLPPYGQYPLYFVYKENIPKYLCWIKKHILSKIDKIYFNVYYKVNRYDIVKLDMEQRYADIDYRMFLACFSLLQQYVEHELGKQTPDNSIDSYISFYKGYRLHSNSGSDEKAIDLYLWYLNEKQNNHRFDTHIVESIEYQEKLFELIKMRNTLWT